MGILFLVLGVLLFAVTAMDIIQTTFTTNGGGRITGFVSGNVWKAFFLAAGRNGRSPLLEYAGPTILVCILIVWIAGMWSALLLVLLSDPDSVRDSSTHLPAGLLEKLYFAGFTLSTLGTGDYVPASDTWRVVTSISAFAGIAFITTSITYFVPVLNAVNLQSRISLYISSMGNTPQRILINSWNGEDFSSFFDNASGLANMIMQHILNHQAYPVIHYYHSSRDDNSIKRTLVMLDEVLLILSHAVAGDTGKDELKLKMLRGTFGYYINIVKEASSKTSPGKGSAPVPDLDEMEGAGIPLRKEGAGYVSNKEVEQHREDLTALLESDGWTWQDVYGTEKGSQTQQKMSST